MRHKKKKLNFLISLSQFTSNAFFAASQGRLLDIFLLAEVKTDDNEKKNTPKSKLQPSKYCVFSGKWRIQSYYF